MDIRQLPKHPGNPDPLKIALDKSVADNNDLIVNYIQAQQGDVKLLDKSEQPPGDTDLLVCSDDFNGLGQDLLFPVLTYGKGKHGHYSCDKVAPDLENLPALVSLWGPVATLFRHLGLEKLSHVNNAQLADLEKLGGPGVAADGIRMLVRSARLQLTEAGSRIGLEDAEYFSRIAHQIKGSGGTLGAERLSEACRQWENRLNQGILDECRIYIALLLMLVRYFECFSKHWA